MLNFYIDESGSMTTEYTQHNPYFIIALVKVNNIKKLNRVYKYFVKKYHDELILCPKADRMFKDEKFVELKGSAMTGELKKKFVEFFTLTPGLFEVFIIKVDNKAVEKDFYKNTARAFNYLLKLAFQFLIHNKFIPENSVLSLQIDERNQSTESKSSLEDYLDTQLRLEEHIIDDIKVSYFDSANNPLVQIADVFANLEFTQLFNPEFKEEFEKIQKNGFLKYIFKFPKNKMAHRYRKKIKNI